MDAFNKLRNGFFFSFCILLFVGCNSRDSDKSQTQRFKHDSYQPQTHSIEIKDMSFQPADLTVHKGDTVIWINKDIVTHDVTEDNKVWASPPLTSESSWKQEITKSASYYCSIHVVMKGKLTVEE